MNWYWRLWWWSPWGRMSLLRMDYELEKWKAEEWRKAAMSLGWTAGMRDTNDEVGMLLQLESWLLEGPKGRRAVLEGDRVFLVEQDASGTWQPLVQGRSVSEVLTQVKSSSASFRGLSRPGAPKPPSGP